MKIVLPKSFNSLSLFIPIFLFSSCLSDKKIDREITEANLYSEHVRTTEFQTPEEELKSFVVPEGFKVTLFASEPDITKPINMEFDQKGRLWVTQSSEYPIAAVKGNGKDKISILEDTNSDGKADKITDFADNLNIPIGILPIHNGAIAYSIPNLYYFKDENGDGRADPNPKVLFGPFGHEDTHGMVNNLIRGYDGWIYACHGFTNTSDIEGADGYGISMTSGNTFRFKEDGSRVEQTTYGRVNPFGFAFDERGYLYSTDCHSKPIYQLIPQGDYPHFGKIPPALGFAPEMMTYNLGSTALAGLVLYTAKQFPEEYRNCFYSGDVVTCRIDRNTMTFEGTTPIAHKKEPLLVSRDPWFRPVDIKVGRDGALYVADFYNRIIGHYEVPLGHEGRDRTSGRIWRISYEGKENSAAAVSLENSIEFSLRKLSDSSLKTRMDATNFIVDHFGRSAVSSLNDLAQKKDIDKYGLIHILWALHRLGALERKIISLALENSNTLVQLHGVRLLGEMPALSAENQQRLLVMLEESSDPHVKRVIAEVLGRFTSASHVNALIKLYESTPAADTHLKYTAILSVRMNLKNDTVLKKIVSLSPTDKNQFQVLSTAMLDLPSTESAAYLLKHFDKYELSHAKMVKIATYLARMLDTRNFNGFLITMKNRYGDQNSQQFEIIRSIEEGIVQRGGIRSKMLDDWVESYSKSVLENLPDAETSPTNDNMETLNWAIENVGKFRQYAFEPMLNSILSNQSLPIETRISSALSLLQLNRKKNLKKLFELYRSGNENEDFKIALTPVLASVEDKSVLTNLESQLNIRNRELQIAIAKGISKEQYGIDLLLDAVEERYLRIDVLYEKEIIDALTKTTTIKQSARFEEMKERFGKDIEDINLVVSKRIESYRTDENGISAGSQIFAENCMICHQVGGEGQVIGPQLDGIGNWGLEALSIKILDPNRNISQSFRNYSITLEDGQILNGLFRREEGETVVFADITGTEFKVNKQSISDQKPLGTTLMPDNFKNALDQDDFNALMDYLLSLK